MFKSLLIILFTFITTDLLFAQQNELEIQGTTNNLYVQHTVAPKENFYSIGRMYNVNAKELASYNHLHFQSGLDIGQIVKIPLTKNNFTQSTKSQPNYSLVPVYHTVAAGETLYRLGVNYNKVSLASLKKWNNLSSDAVSVGNRMIVGYLKVDKQLSTLDNNAGNTVTASTVNQQKEPNPNLPQTASKTPPADSNPTTPENTEATQPVSQAEKNPSVAAAKNTNSSEGVFKPFYDAQIANKPAETKSGQAGVFKSTSGWQDGKYYCFSNDAPAGTILKITNNSTGKSVYAKVLDTIPDIQQNAGLIVVVSNAAAGQLGNDENKFDCVVSY